MGDRKCFSEKDLKTWSGIVMLEFSILADNEFEKSMMENYISKLNQNCASCNVKQKQNLDTFIKLLQKEWDSLLKN